MSEQKPIRDGKTDQEERIWNTPIARKQKHTILGHMDEIIQKPNEWKSQTN